MKLGEKTDMQNDTLRDRPLSDLDDWQLEDSDQDVRGSELVNVQGTPLGKIRDMLVDLERERVSAVVLDDGRVFPVESLEIRDDAVITHETSAEPRPAAALYEATLIRRTEI